MSNLLLLVAQIAAILTVARLVGYALGAVGQPRVVGEMVAGILLGPSLFGRVAPDQFHALFPPASLGPLSGLSQIGLLAFMFLVGLQLDPILLRGRGRTVVVTSYSSIIAPFLLGGCLALFLHPRLSDSAVAFTGFALFMGAAMSVTAFPVLVRILVERGLMHTRLGSLAIACAAVDDVTAWAILAGVVLIVRGGEGTLPFPLIVGGSVVYVGAMLTVVRRALRWLDGAYHRHGRVSSGMGVVIVLLVVTSAWVSDRLGIHAVFGAFLAGVVSPKNPALVRALVARFEKLVVLLFAPLFFAFSGLRTSVSLIGGDQWLYLGLILVVAVVGKMGGTALAARMTGMSWRESWALGTLMNTRGLMGLVILNVGLDIGVISPALFAMMVIMALVTTVMTTPLLGWIYPARLAGVADPPAGTPSPAARG